MPLRQPEKGWLPETYWLEQMKNHRGKRYKKLWAFLSRKDKRFSYRERTNLHCPNKEKY